MKKFFRRITATIMATLVLISTPVTANAENDKLIINGYECYERDGEYYTLINETEYHIAMPVETKVVTDPILLEQLNSLFEENSKARSDYPSTTWPNARTLDISDGSTYTARVNVDYSDYYSPGLKVDIPDGLSAGTIVVDYVAEPGTTTYTIKTTLHIYTLGNWVSHVYNFGYNGAIKGHILNTGTASVEIDKVCFKLAKGSTCNGAFDFSYTQP